MASNIFKEPPACGRPIECRFVSDGATCGMYKQFMIYDRSGKFVPESDPVFSVHWRCVVCGVEWSEAQSKVMPENIE